MGFRRHARIVQAIGNCFRHPHVVSDAPLEERFIGHGAPFRRRRFRQWQVGRTDRHRHVENPAQRALENAQAQGRESQGVQDFNAFLHRQAVSQGTPNATPKVFRLAQGDATDNGILAPQFFHERPGNIDDGRRHQFKSEGIQSPREGRGIAQEAFRAIETKVQNRAKFGFAGWTRQVVRTRPFGIHPIRWQVNPVHFQKIFLTIL